MSPIRLTLAPIKRAYREKRLSAQGPTPACQYRDDSGRPCAIGACIPDGHPLIESGEVVSALINQGHLIANDPRRFSRIQSWHDAWCRASKSSTGTTYNPISAGDMHHYTPAECEAQFRKELGL